MRVLIVHHGKRPTPDQPVTGGALRALDMARAMEAAGHTVRTLNRDQDDDGGFSSAEDLYAKARAWGPDRIIAVQLEDAPALAAVGVPIAVDLYAPRVMEASFEGTLRWTSVETLRALAAGDAFLVSNPRQRWLWWGLLAVAGIDVRRDPTLLVPLVAPDGPDEVPQIARICRWRSQLALAGPTPDSSACCLTWTSVAKERWFSMAVYRAQMPLDASRTPAIGNPWMGRPRHLSCRSVGCHCRHRLDGSQPRTQACIQLCHADYLGCGPF